MYCGIVDRESLEKTEVLDTLTTIKVLIEHHPESESPYWHAHHLRVSEDEILSVIKKISKITNRGWFSIFWNEKNVYLVFRKRVFKLPKKGWKESEEYQMARGFGIENGVQEEYLDLEREFGKFNKHLTN